MSLEIPPKTNEAAPDVVELPSPTAWPIVLAFGITLVFAGMLTTAVVSILGAILAVSGSIGWFRDVLPREEIESAPVVAEPAAVTTSRPVVARVGWITHEPHRARLPIEIYPISAGVKGGLAGGAVMGLLAIAYGLIAQHSIWYPINLLSAGFFPEAENTTAQLSAFQPYYLMLATLIHLITSLLVGLLYGAMLPMLPRHPILLGGVIAPILWSGLIHSFLEVVDPVLNRRISWPWFVITQVGFGIIAGFIVSKHHRIQTWQHLPFGIRAGIETPGAIEERDREDRRQ
jgi:hypothetical protein